MGAARLCTFVHVDGVVWGPDDAVPAAVAKRITAPEVWADGGGGAAALDEESSVARSKKPVEDKG